VLTDQLYHGGYAKQFTDFAPISALVGFRAWYHTNAMIQCVLGSASRTHAAVPKFEGASLTEMACPVDIARANVALDLVMRHCVREVSVAGVRYW
jgi:hypothetical protein